MTSPTDGRVHEVTLPGLGTYRLLGRGRYDIVSVAGLPTDEVDEALGLAGRHRALIVSCRRHRRRRRRRHVRRTPPAGAAARGGRHRAPRRRAPPASGEIDLSERVPARLTDERTEVGQVGAALNAMLDHVESSLDQRHRSEQQVRQFVADASHELRTPLATIAGST